MAKSRPEPISIEIEGRQYQLAFNLEAISAFDEATGINLMTQSINIFNLTPRQLQAIIWACMQINDSPPTLKEVGLMLHPGNSADILRQLAEHVNEVIPDPSDGGDADPNVSSPAG